jgi:hypothetical protein
MVPPRSERCQSGAKSNGFVFTRRAEGEAPSGRPARCRRYVAVSVMKITSCGTTGHTSIQGGRAKLKLSYERVRHPHKPQACLDRSPSLPGLPGDCDARLRFAEGRNSASRFVATADLILVAIYLVVASILAWLVSLSRGGKERVYFVLCASSATFGLLRTICGDAALPAAQDLRVIMLSSAVAVGTWVLAGARVLAHRAGALQPAKATEGGAHDSDSAGDLRSDLSTLHRSSLEAGRGTTFTVTLPWDAESEKITSFPENEIAASASGR